ncbi:MAG: ABC transporter permease [Acidimicrobiales bacterium]
MVKAITRPTAERVLELDGSPTSARAALAEAWGHRDVLAMLARSEFQVRYKRASFGILWAVAVPMVQAIILAVVFSRVIKLGGFHGYAAYVISGTLAWSYFASTLATGATAIVDGAGLTEKVWFPRALLPIVSALANVVSLGVSMAVLVAVLPLTGGHYSPRLLLLVPACLLLVMVTSAMSLALAALHVYFRDVRFLVQAALMVWFYVTPIIYQLRMLGKLQPVLIANPLTGVIGLFHAAVLGPDAHWLVSLSVSLGATLVLVAVSVLVYRRHDRLFADLL